MSNTCACVGDEVENTLSLKGAFGNRYILLPEHSAYMQWQQTGRCCAMARRAAGRQHQLRKSVQFGSANSPLGNPRSCNFYQLPPVDAQARPSRIPLASVQNIKLQLKNAHIRPLFIVVLKRADARGTAPTVSGKCRYAGQHPKVRLEQIQNCNTDSDHTGRRARMIKHYVSPDT